MVELERIPVNKTDGILPPNYTGGCTECGYPKVTYIHDLKCSICDNKTIVYCPNCGGHFKVKF